MAYTSLQDFYNQQYATDIAKNPGDYDVGRVLNTPSQKSALIRQVLPTLQEGGLYEIDGTKAIKQGNQFVPVIGDAEGVYGKATKLDFGQAELLPVGASIRPMEYAINAGQSSATAEAKYQSALNDTSTPRVSFDFSKVDAQGNPLATTMTGAEGLAAQNAARTAYNAETAKVTPYGYQETAQDKLVRENLAKGIPIGSANAPKEQPKYVSTYKGNSIIDFLSSVKQDSSFANRAKLAAEQGITGYKGTAEQNLALLAKLRGATTATPATETPKAPSGTTTASGMTSEEKITTPGATPGADTAGAMVTGAATTLADFLKQLTPAETETEKKQQTLLDKMTSLVGDAAKQSADQLTAEQAAGLPELRKQFADINGQILTKTAEYNVLQAANANKPITMSSILGSERAILNAQAADIGLLTARAQALQGQIETAQNTVNRSIDLKYDTITKQLDVYQAQLNALEPTLNKEEKRLATAQQLMIDERKQALEDKKAAEKEKSGVILDLIGQYPDAGITFTDTLAQAQAKLPKSRIYQDKVRGPVRTGTTPTTGVYTRGANPAVDSWVDLINSGKATVANVPANLKNAVAEAITQSATTNQQNQEIVAQAQSKIKLADEILSNVSGFKGAVGPTALTRVSPLATLTGSRTNFIAGVQQLVNQETLASLLALKKAGGTLGALNESEGQMLRDAASKINYWATGTKNADGVLTKVTGYNASEADFRKEINRIKELAQKAITESTKDSSDPLNLGINANPLGLDLKTTTPR